MISMVAKERERGELGTAGAGAGREGAFRRELATTTSFFCCSFQDRVLSLSSSSPARGTPFLMRKKSLASTQRRPKKRTNARGYKHISASAAARDRDPVLGPSSGSDPHALRRQNELALLQSVDHTDHQHGWYMISTAWLVQWLRFAASDGPPPGMIDNNVLLENWDPGRPRAKLYVKQDYRGLHADAWGALHRIYGGGPAIARSHLDIYSAPWHQNQDGKSRGGGGAAAAAAGGRGGACTGSSRSGVGATRRRQSPTPQEDEGGLEQAGVPAASSDLDFGSGGHLITVTASIDDRGGDGQGGHESSEAAAAAAAAASIEGSGGGLVGGSGHGGSRNTSSPIDDAMLLAAPAPPSLPRISPPPQDTEERPLIAFE